MAAILDPPSQTTVVNTTVFSDLKNRRVIVLKPIVHGKKSMGAITILRLTRRNSTENNTDS